MTYVSWPNTLITLDRLVSGGVTAGSILFGGSSNALAQDNANLFWDDANNRMGISITTPGAAATSCAFDVSAWGLLLGADNSATTARTRTNATTKQAALVCPHYTNAEEPMCMVQASSSNGATVLGIGGGLGQYNAAKTISFFAAANDTTIVGSQIGQLNLSGWIISTAVTTPLGRLHVSEDNALTGSSFPGIYNTVTWNNGATTFTGWTQIVTDSASAAASLLLDMKIGANSVWNVRKDGRPQYLGNTAVPAGGTAGLGILFFNTSNLGVYAGTGAPSLSAAKGSLYTNTTATTTTTRLYVNTDGGTTWANFTASA